MRLNSTIVALSVVVSGISATSCSHATEPTTPVPSALVGTWIGDTIRHTPRGSTALRLEIEAMGRFMWIVRTTGLYAGQSPDALSGGTREVGQLSVVDRRARFLSDSLYIATADNPGERASLLQPASKATFGKSTLFDQAEYAVRGDMLELSYLSYPADSPVRTQLRFVRAKP